MMKAKIVFICSALLCLASACCNSNKTMKEDKTIFGRGQQVEAHFSGDAWVEMLPINDSFDCSVYNVTFAPSVRNDWHRHSVGQILLCSAGEGYYQERGKAARHLVAGDVVNIPANTDHWHGAAPDKEFTHIGITPRVSENSAEWLEPVTDEEYQKATTK